MSKKQRYCPSCEENLLRIIERDMPPSELQIEHAGACDTIKHALEHFDNGYPNAAISALRFYVKRLEIIKK